MIQAFINGYISGFVMSLMLGTVFFALIQHSVDYGFKTGIYIAAGVVISDLAFIAIAVYGSYLVPSIRDHEHIIRIGGAIALFILGFSSWKKRVPLAFPEAAAGTFLFYIGKGMILNVVNPVNFFAWVSISTYLNGVLHYDHARSISYFIACLLAIFVTEALIALAASRLRKIITEKVFMWVNRLAGAVFIIAAVCILWPVVKSWLQ